MLKCRNFNYYMILGLYVGRILRLFRKIRGLKVGDPDIEGSSGESDVRP